MQDRCVGFGLECSTAFREQGEISLAENASGLGCQRAFDDGNDGKVAGVRVGDFLACFQGFQIGLEVGAAGERIADGLVHAGFEVVEVDAGHGFRYMEFAWLAIEAHAIPIEDPVSGV